MRIFHCLAAVCSIASPTLGWPSKHACDYWLEDLPHQGVSAFGNTTDFLTWRNVKDFGAKGDGISDDSAAINRAISFGGTCAPGNCSSTTTAGATVYFPGGTYLVSSSIVDFYSTHLIGNAVCPPVLKAAHNFSGPAIIDGNPRLASGSLGFSELGLFFRQARNFAIDMTELPSHSNVTGIYWPTAQAHSLQNIRFDMHRGPDSRQTGLYIEVGAGGFLGDLAFHGGLYGLNIGNEHFTIRNVSFEGCSTAVHHLWDWGLTYQNIRIRDCGVGFNISAGGGTDSNVAAVVIFDSEIADTPVGITSGRSMNYSTPKGGSSLVLENIALLNVPVAVQGPDAVALNGTNHPRRSMVIDGWAQGTSYTPEGNQTVDGHTKPNLRPKSLVQANGKYYERSKPQFEHYPAARFLSARSHGAKGDGDTDDTIALQNVINKAAKARKIVFIDAGVYKVTHTIYVPSGSIITGEAFPVIMSAGEYFNDWSHPKPMLRLGRPGECGQILWTDTIVSTQGSQKGVILIEWNLASEPGAPSGMWDVHARIGGSAGSELELAQCKVSPGVAKPLVDEECISTFLAMHVTKHATGLYMENVWLWTADHELDAVGADSITVYAGRGLLIESEKGVLWLYGTAVEHYVKYQYQLAGTKDIVMGHIQTETPYYQPNPGAAYPFPYVASLGDPQFPLDNDTIPLPLPGNTDYITDAWALRIVNSESILVYGASLYSFFVDQNITCSLDSSVGYCQKRLTEVKNSTNVAVYGQDAVGTEYIYTVDGKDLAYFNDSYANYLEEHPWYTYVVAVFRSE
ncbi:hypothetical protein LTR56_025560 [Elasticomyces elasticus]|nr:hypothetical protein LTR56_025560 [Elasticomyces elasticus]KAK3649906.1 hypothetical protein LTR22_012782 [Elasticomyces elasticus]KAK4918143.1 hypothetical protein LTR49_013999 [Elasticomyces elasticus]KAK5757689.1 hypothetical protein LTS12_012148 [Elasticomyces elasticus]